MTLPVRFRVVGLYCYFPDLMLEGLSPRATVEDVMNAIQKQQPAFSYIGVPFGPTNKLIVDTISYEFNRRSEHPPNATQPTLGFRDLENQISMKPTLAPARVWQYYRGVTAEIGGTVLETRARTPGQPSYSVTPLVQDVVVPEGTKILTYNLTWRLVTIQLSPEKQLLFQQAKMKAMQLQQANN